MQRRPFRSWFSDQGFSVADINRIELIDQIWNWRHLVHAFIVHPAVELSTECLQVFWIGFIQVNWKRDQFVLSGGARVDAFSQVGIAKILPVPDVVPGLMRFPK